MERSNGASFVARPRRVRGATLALFLLATALPALLLASASGPEDGHAGEPPGGSTCAESSCHTDYPIDSGGGTFSLEGVPAYFSFGKVYPVTVHLQQPGQQRWGFELTVVRDDGTRGGTILVSDPVNTQLSSPGGPEYLKHTQDGTYAGVGEGASWSFLWEPDVDDIRVTFYAAGNAANGDEKPTGDYVYTTSAASEVATKPAVVEETWTRLKRLYRR